MCLLFEFSTYYHISPYAWCGNNWVNIVDINGVNWYRNDSTKYLTWFDDERTHQGYTLIGEKGSVLGEFETIIDNLLTNIYGVESMYSNGFTFEFSPLDKGAIVGAKGNLGSNFLDDFIYGLGPEFSILTCNHPYTQQMINDKKLAVAYEMLSTDKSQITGYAGSWHWYDVFLTKSIAKQFIGSYRYDVFVDSSGKYYNHIISDTKSITSLFYHIFPDNFNIRRNVNTNGLGTTFQFYIWQTLITQ